jgi:hypothetical protein
MLSRINLVVVLAIGLLLGSFVAPDRVSAAVPDLSDGSNQRSSTASMSPDYMQLAGRRGGGSARSRGSRPQGGNNRSRNVNKGTNRKVNKNTNRKVNKNVNRNVNVNVRTRGYGWRGARWGAVAFGVTMGAIIVVAANYPPYPPDPSLCWTWGNAALTNGYWYYCDGP